MVKMMMKINKMMNKIKIFKKINLNKNKPIIIKMKVINNKIKTFKFKMIKILHKIKLKEMMMMTNKYIKKKNNKILIK